MLAAVFANGARLRLSFGLELRERIVLQVRQIPAQQLCDLAGGLKAGGRAMDLGCGRGELTYYLARQGPNGRLGLARHVTGRERLWIIREPPSPRSQLERALRPFSYRVARVWRFTPGFDQQLVLAVPD